MAHQIAPVHHASGWRTSVCVCCNGCCGSTNDPEKVECDLCCAAMFCPCAVLNSNVKMMETRTYHPPCDFQCTKPCSIWTCLSMASCAAYFIARMTRVDYVAFPAKLVYLSYWRLALRIHYGIAGDPFTDCLCHWFCSSCALCQEHIELKKRTRGTNNHAQVVTAQPYSGGRTQTNAPDGQVMPSAADRQVHGRSARRRGRDK